jgi:hypothetical protein
MQDHADNKSNSETVEIKLVQGETYNKLQVPNVVHPKLNITFLAII